MRRHVMPAVAGLVAVMVVGSTRAGAADEPGFALPVARGHLIGASTGTLRITAGGLAYETPDKGDARRWTYWDLQQIQIESPTRLTVRTYEDQGRIKLGKDRLFAFELRRGRIGPDLVAFILARTNRTVVTSVLPPIAKSPLYRLPVKHERQGRGSDGVLLLYDDALVYGSERTGETRYWRFSDLFAVLPLDRDRLQVMAYEGGAGHLRPFTFQLKAPLPDAFARVLWAKVNPPAPLVTPIGPDDRRPAAVERGTPGLRR